MANVKEGIMLKGKKTYLVVAVAIIFNGLVASGYIDESTRESVNAFLGFLGLGTMRAGVAAK